VAKYKNLYRIPSSRAHWWDYENKGAYFITINTKNKNHHFGKIQNGIMCLNAIGAIAYNEWLKSPILRPDMNITLGAHIIMPDHIHGVILIGRNRYNDKDHGMDSDHGMDEDHGKDALQCGSTPGMPSSPTSPYRPTPKNTFGPQRKNLPAIIRGFKTSVTIKARKINPNFGWQERYHDRIIRNQKGLDNVNRYIEDNPMQWTMDRKGR
jgi:REP element-mobilizing transposase RayT